jgi:hypothetical protein
MGRNFSQRFLERLSSFLNAKFPSGLYKPLGLGFVSEFRLRLLFWFFGIYHAGCQQ